MPYKHAADKNRSTRAHRAKIRSEVIQRYGGRCVSCGETDAIVLVIDHVNDDGSAIKKPNGRRKYGGSILYALMKKEGWPSDKYQLLCCNCNIRKEFLRRGMK
jgi:5-methylcytosine-specific restriction endonuclease McrA